MNENGKKKREWVKTAAIVFLSVMLVLTFFSNTIMNYSLPEVATQYVQSGTITAKIRGSGVVESGDPYNVEVKESRKVAGLAVRVGDTVEKDDVLIYLEDEESDELQAAREALEKAESDYRTVLLSVEITAADIQAANMGVSEEAYRQQITAAQNAVTTAENEVTAAKNEVTAAQKQVDDIQTRYDAIDRQISLTPENNADVTAETQYRDEVKAAWDNAKRIQADAKNDLTAKQNRVAELEARVTLLESRLPAENTSEPTQTPDETDSSADSVQDAGTDPSGESETGQQDGLSEVGENVDYVQTALELEQLKAQLNAAREEEINAQTVYNNVSLDATRWEEEYNRAVQALEDKMSSGSTAGIISSLRQQQAALSNELATARNVLTEKQTNLSNKETALSDRQNDLTELAARIGKVSGLEAAQEVVDRARKQVEELEARAVNATITAPIAGTVTALNVTAGRNTDASIPVAVLQPEGKGYTMSFSVTNEQAKRLAVGDVADLVNAWRYDDVTVTLSNIKPDTTDPSQKKLLTFDVTGSVTEGQTLNISVGQKSSSYDYIVPNSAIREDNNGKFILIVESRPGPLSTRYIASRVDVEVLASDDTQSAVSAALYGYEFVITTSTKPVEAGKQVRLSENNG